MTLSIKTCITGKCGHFFRIQSKHSNF